MAVKVVTMARKKRLETLNPANVGRAVEPIDGRGVPGHGSDVLNSVENTVTQ
jgi:hypothetical protein